MAEKDIMEKTLESYNEVFSDIVNNLVFGGKQEVRADDLTQAVARSVYKADRKLREQERDTAKYWNRVNLRIAYYGLENETEPEEDVPLRLFGYDGAAYRDQLYYEKDENGIRRRNQNPRYPVVTLLLYFGYQKHWNKPLTLHDCLSEIPEKLKPYVNDYKVNLFEIAWLTDEQVARFHSDFQVVADYFVQMRKNGNYVPSRKQLIHVQEVLQLMSVLTQDHRFEEAYNVEVERKENTNMCEVLDRVENRGIAKGIEQGRILEFIDIRREEGYSEDEIIQGIIRKFHLTEDEIQKYIDQKITGNNEIIQ